jgi:hypothetical protein
MGVLLEEEHSWSPASAKPSRKSFANAVKTPFLSGPNAVPLGQPHPMRALAQRSVFYRIIFPATAGHISSSFSLVMVQDTLLTVTCSCCLATSHWRVNYKGPIRCHTCRNPRHVVAAYNNLKIFGVDKDVGKPKNGAADILKKIVCIDASRRPSSPSPSVFNSFTDMAHSFWPMK